MTPGMDQHGKELSHCQALAGCGGTTVPGRLDDPQRSTGLGLKRSPDNVGW